MHVQHTVWWSVSPAAYESTMFPQIKTFYIQNCCEPNPAKDFCRKGQLTLTFMMNFAYPTVIEVTVKCCLTAVFRRVPVLNGIYLHLFTLILRK